MDDTIQRIEKGYFAPGLSANPNGRPKGCKDRKKRMSKSVVNMVIDTLRTLGGEDWLKSLAVENPALYVRLLDKAMPSEVNVSGQMTFEDRLAKLKGESEKDNAVDQPDNSEP